MPVPTPVNQLFYSEQDKSQRPPKCYLWDVYASQWEAQPLPKDRQVVNHTNRELTHYLIRWAIKLIRHHMNRRVSEANAMNSTSIVADVFDLRNDWTALRNELESEVDYDSIVTRNVMDLFEAVVEDVMEDGVDPIQFLTPYDREFGVEIWHLESRAPNQYDLSSRTRELISGASGTFKVTGFSAAHDENWSMAYWRVRCTCGRHYNRLGGDLMAGTFAPCDAIPHIDQLIKSGDLAQADVHHYAQTPEARRKIAERDAHIREVRVNHPMVSRQYGDWTVVRFDRVDNRHTYWDCLCKCGSIKSIRQHTLVNGESQSCGNCQSNKIATAFRTVLGLKSSQSKGTSAGVRETLLDSFTPTQVKHILGSIALEDKIMSQQRASAAERHEGYSHNGQQLSRHAHPFIERSWHDGKEMMRERVSPKKYFRDEHMQVWSREDEERFQGNGDES